MLGRDYSLVLANYRERHGDEGSDLYACTRTPVHIGYVVDLRVSTRRKYNSATAALEMVHEADDVSETLFANGLIERPFWFRCSPGKLLYQIRCACKDSIGLFCPNIVLEIVDVAEFSRCNEHDGLECPVNKPTNLISVIAIRSVRRD